MTSHEVIQRTQREEKVNEKTKSDRISGQKLKLAQKFWFHLPHVNATNAWKMKHSRSWCDQQKSLHEPHRCRPTRTTEWACLYVHMYTRALIQYAWRRASRRMGIKCTQRQKYTMRWNNISSIKASIKDRFYVYRLRYFYRIYFMKMLSCRKS